MTVAGIDLSNNQPVALFDQIRAAGYEFCIHKCSEGVGFFDRYLPRRWEEMKENNVARACYHFARPSQSSASDEADYFLGCLDRISLEPGDSVWLDYEDERLSVGTNGSPWAIEWCEIVEQSLGFRPGIYTYPSYITERGLTDPRLARYPLWWASYADPMRPTPDPWTTTAVWQYTSDGQVPGTGGARIDLNWFLGDSIDGFLALGMPGREAAETDVLWRGEVTGREHWGGDPLSVERRGNQLYRLDGFDLTGLAVDDWQTTTAAAGQLTITAPAEP